MALGLLALAPLRSGAQAPAPLDVTILTPDVTWSTAPDTPVRLVLQRGEAVLAEVATRASLSGTVEASFVGGQGIVPIRDGDRLGVHADGAPAFTRTVPALTTRIDLDTRVVSGTAPAGARLAVRVLEPGGAAAHSEDVDSDGDGVYRVTLPGALDLGPGVWGTVTHATGAGDRFTARWDVLTAVVTLGTPAVDGRATLGGAVRATLRAGDGTEADSGPAITVTGRPDYRLSLARGDQPHAVAAGDVVSVRQDDRVLLAGPVPRLTARVDELADTVSGLAPPGAALVVSAAAISGTVEAATTADAQGRYAVGFAGRVDLGRGVAVHTRYAPGRLAFRARGVPEHVTATLYSASLVGTALPGAWVTANLSRRDGAADRRASGGAIAGADGVFRMTLVSPGGGGPLPAQPGDRILVAFDVEGDPHTLVLPGLVATADAATDEVAGIALPLAPVEVAIAGRPQTAVRTRAGGGGAFLVDFTGRFDIEPGTAGTAVTELASRDTVALEWAVPQVDMLLGDATVSGFGPRGRAVRLELARAGRAIASAEGAVADADPARKPNWSLALRDAAGEAVAAQGGDGLAVRIGEWSLDLDVPVVTVEANTAADFVLGRAPAGRPVRVRVSRVGGGEEREVRAGADGRYSLGLAGRWDLRANDAVSATVALDGGHTATAVMRVPGLMVDLDTSVVVGYAGPFAVVQATLSDRLGASRAGGTATADAAGRFELQLHDGRGQAVPPVEGDTLEIVYGANRVAMPIPRLTVTVDPLADTVSGEATPGGEVTVSATTALGGARSQGTRLAVPRPDGGYDVGFAGDLDVAAGTRLQVSFRTPDGHVATRDRRLPIVHVQRGGNLVSGYVGAGAAVSVSLGAGGRAAAWAAATARADGAFDAFLAAQGGAPAAAGAGDDLDVRWSAGDGRQLPAAGEVRVAVAPISATVNAATGVVTGTAPAGTVVDVTPGGLGGGGATLRVTAGADGRFALPLPGGRPLAAGLDVEAGMLDAEGHRTFARAVVPYLEVTLGEPRVTGRAAPLAPLGLALGRDADTVADGGGRGDTFGHFAALLRGTGGFLGPQPGQALTLSEPGSLRTTLVLPTLSIRVDLGAGALRGTGPADTPVAVRIRARGRPEIQAEAWTDAQGAWSLDATALPPGLLLADLLQAEARLAVDNGHLVVVQALRTPTATPTAPVEPSPTATRTPATPTVGASATATRTATARRTGGVVYVPGVYRSGRVR